MIEVLFAVLRWRCEEEFRIQDSCLDHDCWGTVTRPKIHTAHRAPHMEGNGFHVLADSSSLSCSLCASKRNSDCSGVACTTTVMDNKR